MPGLTIVSSPEFESSSLLQTARTPSFTDRHTATHLWNSTTLDIVASSYPSYPIRTFETPEYWMCVEGGLYGTPQSRQRDLLLDWSEALVGSSSTSLPRSISNTDGDFIVVVVQKSTEDWAVVNDVMGRLPLYLHSTASQVCLTRDFHLFNRLPAPPPPDRLGAAQQLTFGYPLGSRTLRKGVNRVGPGTVFLSSPSPTTIRHHRVKTYNFESPCQHSQRSITENASRLAERLDQDARARAKWGAGSSILALSGGLDSRSIACSLQRTRCSFEAMTFARPEDKNASDVRYAKKIARQFGLSHQTVSLPPRSTRHLQAILYANGGQNAFNVDYMIPFLEVVTAEKGENAHLITGNGGALLRDLQPPHPLSAVNQLSSMDELLHSLFHDVSRKWLPPQIAAELVGIPSRDLVESVRARLSAYPESSLSGMYSHFAFERLFKYSFEGEDRNREYLWSSAPYHGVHFTQYALNCPNEQKKNYRLYRAFLHSLSPKAVQIGYSDFYGFRMTTFQYNLYRLLRWIVRQVSPLRVWLNRRRGRRSSPISSRLVPSLLKEHLASTEYSILERDVITYILKQPGRWTSRAIDNILTVSLALCPTSESLLSSDLHTDRKNDSRSS